MRRLVATIAGAALAASIAGALPATAAPRALQVTAIFLDSRCQGGDFAQVKLTAQTSGATGDVFYKWDWTNNGSFDTRQLASPTVTHLYPDETTVQARVGARDATGAIAQDSVQFTTPRCG